MPGRLQRLIERVLNEQFGGVKQSLAAAIGVSGSRLGRVLQGEFSLSVLSCLKLAKAAGRDPGSVLRDADKADVAALLDEFYSPARKPLPSHEQDLLERWRALRPDTQKVLIGLIDDLNRVRSGKSGARSA